MAITTVQKHAQTTASGTSGACPAWSPATTAGNLLLIVINELGAFTGTWSTPPSGYTAYSPTPFIYWPTPLDPYGIFWKIAAGSDATPGNVGADGGSAGPWIIYTYEFSAPNGWLTTPNDAEAHSAASSTAVTSIASGSTATLAQANELAVAVLATSVAISTATLGGSWAHNDPGVGADTRLQVGTQETAATTALSFSPLWTTSARAGARIATFKTAAAAPADFAPFAARGTPMDSGEPARYERPRSRIFSTFSPTPPDLALVQAAVSARSLPIARRSTVVGLFDTPPAAAPALALGVASRASRAYAGSYSLNAGAADQLTPETWTRVTRGRASAGYLVPRSQTVLEPFAPATAADAWATQPRSRSVSSYAPPRQVTSVVYDPSTSSFRDWTPPPVSGGPGRPYTAPRSLVFASWDDHACTTLLPDTMLLPDTILFPTLCAQTDWAAASQSATVARMLTHSRAVSVYAPQAAAAADTWTQVFLSRRVAVYLPPASQAITPDPSPAVTPDVFAGVTVGRVASFYSAPRAIVQSCFDNPAQQQGFIEVAQSRAGSLYVVTRSRVSSAGDQPLDAYAFVVGQRAVELYSTLPSLTTDVFDSAAIAQQLYATLARSRSVQAYATPLSLAINVRAGAAPDVALPRVVQSRLSGPYSAPRAQVIVGLAPAALIAQGYVALARSRAPLSRLIAAASTTILPEGILVVTAPNQGGGGEWVIWGKPDFPGNRPGAFSRLPRPDFRRPSRREQRGY